MNAWSRRRKLTILSVIIFVLLFLIGAPFFFLFYRAPTCFDGKQNGGETGVDCGGPCQLLCPAESLPLILKGDPRVINLGDNIFEVAALVDNPNISGEVLDAGYTIRLYSASSAIPVRVIEGSTYVPKGDSFVILEGPFELGAGIVPTRATLEWKLDTLKWIENVLPAPGISLKNSRLSREDSAPRLDVDVENFSLEGISNIDLIALVSDGSGNILAASRTFVEYLPPGRSVPAVFIWRKPFGSETINLDIMIRVFPDRNSILQ